ncbi:hypothetical protein EDD18DRAFT_1108100 [Armillaria luteobubalina]|uniref:Uncharacterized protein n=1 Tax=Armillaria luteobubalina TaxID=153913 RepID=A0AA39Q0C3_9AGAR|nr:hypothetical protein EDD18DRAFT_1108100 [Armillaria luteobubalina]
MHQYKVVTSSWAEEANLFLSRPSLIQLLLTTTFDARLQRLPIWISSNSGVPKDIVGAGYTTMVAFAKFTLQIGTIKETNLAYILEVDSGFRPRWEDNSFFLTSPKTHATVRIQAICSPLRSPSPPVTQPVVRKIEDLFTLNNTSSDTADDYSGLPDLIEVEDSDDEDDKEEDYYADNEADFLEDIAHPPEPTTSTTRRPCKLGQFAKKLKDTVTTKFPRLFQKKVGYPPSRRWVHHIDTGNAQPV